MSDTGGWASNRNRVDCVSVAGDSFEREIQEGCRTVLIVVDLPSDE